MFKIAVVHTTVIIDSRCVALAYVHDAPLRCKPQQQQQQQAPLPAALQPVHCQRMGQHHMQWE
jgi:hypothetical protein